MDANEKQVVKLSREYLEFIINSLNLLNDATDDQVQAFCGLSKHAALRNLANGLRSTLDKAIAK